MPGIGAVFSFGNIAQKNQFLFYENKIIFLFLGLTLGFGGSIIKEPKGKADDKNKIAERQKEVIIMAQEIVNAKNGKELEKVYDDFYMSQTFADAVKQASFGFWAVLPNWEMVEDVLDCFNDNEDFIIEQVGNTFYMCKPNEKKKNSKTQMLNRMKRLKAAYAKGEIYEIEQVSKND